MVNNNEEWSIDKYIQEAQREPERLKFWMQYYDYNNAYRARSTAQILIAS
jgi:hypothetical protein